MANFGSCCCSKLYLKQLFYNESFNTLKDTRIHTYTRILNLLKSVCFICIQLCIFVVAFLGGEIPKVVVSDSKVFEHDDDVTLICNVTERGNIASTPLKRISWLKDNVLLETLRNPEPQNPRDRLGPLKIKDVGVRDGGKYTCLLEVLLRNIREYNVSDNTVIHSKYNALPIFKTFLVLL